MKKLLLIAAATSFAFATPAIAFNDTVVYGQEDCKEGEKWNEDTKKCEPTYQFHLDRTLPIAAALASVP